MDLRLLSVLMNKKNKNMSKVFGIGFNKTGTTSLQRAMTDLGYKVGLQKKAEILHHHWAKRNFSPIIEYCAKADFFQDIPFSLPFTYIALDIAFPNSKFILTVRDSPEQWYNSLVKFHSTLWGKEDQIPCKEDLINADYVYKGWAWEIQKLVFNIEDSNPYNKNRLIKAYVEHNSAVLEYFRSRTEDLLVLNVGQNNAFKRLSEFLNVISIDRNFPWENKTN